MVEGGHDQRPLMQVQCCSARLCSLQLRCRVAFCVFAIEAVACRGHSAGGAALSSLREHVRRDA